MPSGTPSIIETAVLEAVEGLTSMGHSVTVACTRTAKKQKLPIWQVKAIWERRNRTA